MAALNSIASNVVLTIKDSRRGDQVLINDAVPVDATELIMVSCTPATVGDAVTCLPFLDDFILAAMMSFDEQFFFAATPATSNVRSLVNEGFEFTDELLGSVLGYFDASEELLRKVLTRRRSATYEEWVIGSCRRRFERPVEPRWFQRAIYWNSDLFSTRMEMINCVSIYFGESGESVLYTRPFQNVDGLLSDLRGSSRRSDLPSE